jgi:hypothetical protein
VLQIYNQKAMGDECSTLRNLHSILAGKPKGRSQEDLCMSQDNIKGMVQGTVVRLPAMEACSGSRGVAPLILTLSIK